MSKNTQSRSQLIQKLSKKLVVATPLVVAAFGMSQVATAQAGNCPAGSTLSGGICLATSSYQTPTYRAQPEATGEAESSSYTASGEAEGTGEAEATGSSYKASGEAEATGSAYKAQGEARLAQLIKLRVKPKRLAQTTKLRVKPKLKSGSLKR